MKTLVTLDIDQLIMTFISPVPSILTTIQAVAQKNEADALFSLLGDLDEVMEYILSSFYYLLVHAVVICMT